ncbi:DUF6461 domain-containing protein [Nonomuraea indica]|uniref:DUF6461 domain-containing protein n=1 Tax=Nonomuraea indica TaxID=1581193 RepID=A0ABW8ACM7_9ACTN
MRVEWRCGRLTGITMTPRLLEESTYLCGVVPGSR